MIMRNFFEMNEIIPGELWFEIARRDFSVWCALTKTIRVFWLYVQKIGREKMLEKLFGSAYVTDFGIRWYVAGKQHRFGGLPWEIKINGPIYWHSKNRSARGNPLCISHSRIKFVEPLHYRREMYYDGYYIIGDTTYDPDNSSTTLTGKEITPSETYFSFGRHRCSVRTIKENGILTYYNCISFRVQNLPSSLNHDGTFFNFKK